MHQNQLFNRTRIQLTGFYAIAIFLIALLSGYGVHLVLIRSFERVVNRELDTLAGTVHDVLEAVLEQPEIVNKAAINSLPGLCVNGKECSLIKADSKIVELTKKQGYCLRLLNLNGEEIAALGSKHHQFIDRSPTLHWETITDSLGERYHIHTLKLKTNEDKDWGYLQVAQSFHRLDEYMSNLHLILLVGIPIAILLISGVSWWLSGLAMQPIYQSYDRIRQFTADAAHELRTPLAVTRIALESALEQGTIKPEARTDLKIAQRQIHHLSSLAADLLWLSRLEARQLPLPSQPCCLNDLVADLEEELAPLALERSIDLQLKILVNQPIYVIADPDRLYRAIANLIDNGIKYTQNGGIVRITLAYSNHTATVTIEDNGIGIAAEDLPQIFDRFYRVQSDRSRTSGGTGLGLAIVKAIVSTYHGTIQVESEIEQGSTFTVKFPSTLN